MCQPSLYKEELDEVLCWKSLSDLYATELCTKCKYFVLLFGSGFGTYIERTKISVEYSCWTYSPLSIPSCSNLKHFQSIDVKSPTNRLVFATDQRSHSRWFWMKRQSITSWRLFGQSNHAVKALWPIKSRREGSLANPVLLSIGKEWSVSSGSRVPLCLVHMCFSHIPPRYWRHCFFDSSICT